MNLSDFSAKKLGCTDFVDPKDHDKPVQEVCQFISKYWIMITLFFMTGEEEHLFLTPTLHWLFIRCSSR
jgi:cbb3-type cytochrome oxidase subunit 1